MRELTSTDIRNLAKGYWDKYFNWRLYPKSMIAFIIAIVLLGSAVPFFVMSDNDNNSDVKAVYTSPVREGTVEVRFADGGDDVGIFQNGSQVPMIESDTDEESLTDNLSIALILTIASFIAVVVGLFLYVSSKSEFLDWSAERWEKGVGDKPLPDRQSVKDYLGKGVKIGKKGGSSNGAA